MENSLVTPREERLMTEMRIAARSLSDTGHDDFNQGQISARLPGSTDFLIKDARTGFDALTNEHFVPGNVGHTSTPDRLAPPELPLHQGIYAARNDVNCIIHSHAIWGVIAGALGYSIHPIGHEGAFFADNIGWFRETSQTVLDISVGDQIASELGDHPAIFLVNHGTVVVGKSVRHTTVYAHMLERACKIEWHARVGNPEFSTSSANDIQGKRDFNFSDSAIKNYWGYIETKWGKHA